MPFNGAGTFTPSTLSPKTGIVELYFDQVVEEFYLRFEEKLSLDQETGCWNWIGFQDGKGYGRVSMLGRPRMAYRVAYELYCERIPDGLHLDHLCRNPKCCNPEHLEPVTHAENVRRGHGPEVARTRWLKQSHCKHGHALSGENLIITTRQRVCRTCVNERKKEYRARLQPRKGRNLTGLKYGAHISAEKRRNATHCKNGHEWTPENTGTQASGRYCKACSADRKKGPNRLRALMLSFKTGEAA